MRFENETLTEALLKWQVAREQRATAKANVRAGNYTDGTPMAPDDRILYHGLTVAAVAGLIVIAVMVGALVALAVTFNWPSPWWK